MSGIKKSFAELIGNTPLLEVTNIEKELDLKATVLVKLEYFNPAGSVKDRIAKAQSSLNPPAATPASVSPPSPPPGAIALSLPCRRP